MASKGWTTTLDLGKLRADVRAAAKEALFDAGQIILAESDQHVPIEEGTLSRSGHVSEDDQHLRVAVSYDTPYAVVQHEDMTLNHDAGRTAKYLENAFNSQLGTVRDHLAAQIRKAMGA